MHISDGILNAEVCVGAALAAALITSYSLKKTLKDDIPKISVMTAAFFVASLIHVKIGPSSAHLLLNGLVGITLGISSFTAILVALLFQAIMFQHGGITTLGVNTIAMGLPALIAYGVYKLHALLPAKRNLFLPFFSFIAGFLSVIFSAIFISLFLILTGKEFFETSKVILIVHAPIAIVEGIITLFAVSFLQRIKPEVLQK